MILKSQLIYELDNRSTCECHSSAIVETKIRIVRYKSNQEANIFEI